jgi:hypothetical protein
MNTPTPRQKKRGQIPKGYVDTHILIQPELLEWAKHQPEGLAGLVRRLLADERARQPMPLSAP